MIVILKHLASAKESKVAGQTQDRTILIQSKAKHLILHFREYRKGTNVLEWN